MAGTHPQVTLQGHQAAQKSSSTGAEDWVTFVSKFSWLMVVIAIITLPFGVSVFVGFSIARLMAFYCDLRTVFSNI